MPTMLHIYTRHVRRCSHAAKGIYYHKCGCPKWACGTLPGQSRFYRKSLDTGDVLTAERRIREIEAGNQSESKLLMAAIHVWESSLQIAPSTHVKYFRLLKQLRIWANEHNIFTVRELGIDQLDAFYAERRVSRTTKVREIQTLRSFFDFCVDRRWREDNPARKIKPPKGLKPNEVVPYTQGEITAILAACDRFGKNSYERSRARALVLLLRHAALRIGDAYRLRRDAITEGRIRLYTSKSGIPVNIRLSQDLAFALEVLPPPDPLTQQNEYFFWNGHIPATAKDGGKKFTVERAERLLRAVFAAAGVKNAHAHRFRHTKATELLARGATMDDVAALLGNSVRICEKHYAKWDTKRQDRLDALMEPELHCTYSVHDMDATVKSLLDSLIAGAKGGTRTPTPCGTRS
jgi:site-specific recombinase XerD